MANYFQQVRKGFKLKYYIPYIILVIVTMVFSLLGRAGELKMGTQILLEQIGYSVVAAISLSLVVGFLGELSLGHAAFMSIGAYLGGYFQTYILPESITKGHPLIGIILAMLVGGLCAAVLGFLIGLPALRLKGDYLAIVTLALGEIICTLFQNSKKFGAAIGIDTIRYSRKSLFIICFVVILLVLILVNNFIRSKHGRAMTAIRDNEIAARAMGVNVTYYKLLVFVLSAFIAGIAGVLYGNAMPHISASEFNYNYSINILVMVVFGGMGSINGTIIASVVITYLNNKLPTILTGNLAAMKNFVYALILIVIVVYTNAPALKGFREKYNFRKLWDYIIHSVAKLFNNKHSSHDPAVEKEFGADWDKIPTKIEMDAVLSTDLHPDNTFTPDTKDIK